MGKTVAVAQWAESAAAGGFDVRWLDTPPIAEGNGGESRFWSALLDLLGGPTTRGDGTKAAVVKRVRALREPTVIVIDGYERSTSRRLDLELAGLLDLSGSLHLIVLSRSFSGLDSPIVTSSTTVRIIRAADLAFTAAESQEFASLSGLSRPDAVEALHELVRGWPIAVRIAVRELGSGGDRGALQSQLDKIIAHELETITDSDAQRIVLLVALCPAIDIRLVASMLKIPFTDTAAAVRRLEELGILHRTWQADVTRVHCHPGFVPALRARAVEAFGEERTRFFQHRAALNLGRHDPEKAVQLLLRLGEFDEAAIMIARHFLAVVTGHGDLLPLLRQIPLAQLRGHAVLVGARLLLEGQDPQTSAREIDLLHGLLREAAREGVHHEDPELRITALAMLTVAERMRGSGAAALRLAADLEQRLEENARLGVFVLERSLSYLYAVVAATGMLGGDLGMAERGYTRSCEIATARLDVAEQVRGLTGLSLVAALRGEYALAEQRLAEVEALKQSTGAQNPHMSWANVLAVRMLIDLERGDAAAVRGSLDVLGAARLRSEYFPLFVTIEAALVRLERGPVEALAELRRGAAEADGAFQPPIFSRALVTSSAVELHSCAGDFATAERLLVDELPDRFLSEPVLRARIMLLSGRRKEAIRLLERAPWETFTPKLEIDAGLILAVAHWQEGDREAALEHFELAAALILRHRNSLPLTFVPYLQLCELSAASGGALDAVLERLPETLRCQPHEPLTRSERRTLEAVATMGGTIAQIAEGMFVTPNTVKFHLRSIYRKLEVANREEAVAKARRVGLVEGA